MEDDVRRDVVDARPLEPPVTQPQRLLGPLIRARLGPLRRTELSEEPRPLAGPGEPEHVLRASQADVEQAPLLGELLVGARLLRRQLLLLQPRHEHRLELEALRTVE